MARGRSQKASATSKTGVPVKRRPALKSAPPVKGTASTKSATGARPAGDGRVPVQKSASVTNLMVTLDELKAILLAKRAELVSKLREEREGRRDGVQREKIEGTPFGDRPGLSPDDEMGFAVADRRAGMLAQVDLALKKMDEGSYGRCEACEEPINRLRLRVHPFAVRCTRCQEAWERDQSRVDTAPVRGRSLPEETS